MTADSLSHESSDPFTGDGSPRPLCGLAPPLVLTQTANRVTASLLPCEGTACADTGDYAKRVTASHYRRSGVSHTCSRFTTHENALLRGLYEGLYLAGGMALRGRFTLLKPHTALDQNSEKFLGY